MSATNMQGRHYDSYKAAEAASYMAGLLEFLIRHCEEKDKRLAIYISNSLIDCFERHSWGDHTQKWLEGYREKHNELNQYNNETI